MIDRKDVLARLKPTLIFVAPLILLVLLAGVLRFREQSQPVVMNVDFPSEVQVGPDDGFIPVDFTLHLQNRSREDIDLISQSDCGVFRWYLLDQSGSFVQGQMLEECGDYPVAETLRGRGTLIRSSSIPIDAGRLVPGNRYHLMMQFWGYETRVQFRAEEAT